MTNGNSLSRVRMTSPFKSVPLLIKLSIWQERKLLQRLQRCKNFNQSQNLTGIAQNIIEKIIKDSYLSKETNIGYSSSVLSKAELKRLGLDESCCIDK